MIAKFLTFLGLLTLHAGVLTGVWQIISADPITKNYPGWLALCSVSFLGLIVASTRKGRRISNLIMASALGSVTLGIILAVGYTSHWPWTTLGMFVILIAYLPYLVAGFMTVATHIADFKFSKT